VTLADLVAEFCSGDLFWTPRGSDVWLLTLSAKWRNNQCQMPDELNDSEGELGMTTKTKTPKLSASELRRAPSAVSKRSGARPRSAVMVHQDIQRGLAFQELEAFQQRSQLPLSAIQRVSLLPPRTWQRRKSEGRLKAVESDRLWRLLRLFAKATELFEGNSPAASAWFQQPVEGLGGCTPLEMAETEVGAREVEELIGRLEHGVFS
jgi:putative toxin-antitoxin system antitoxin component (TIGR02293 family)